MENSHHLPIDLEPEFSFEKVNYRASIHVELTTAPGEVCCSECKRPTVTPTKENTPEHGVKIEKAEVKGLFSTDGMYDLDLETEEAKEVEEHILAVLNNSENPTIICGKCFPKMVKILSK